ncbi:MAG: ABC transporter permease, partial [Candidatus Margulisbacteria bacterium]|nr:ABC transporter permease [Candidatus Margulisiibacteriota bacterium]
KELNDQGHSIIMVTHEHDIAGWASRVLTLSDGRIIEDRIQKDIPRISLPQFSFDERQRRRIFHLSGLKNYCQEAFAAILSNKLRSLLSILGVMIGVAAVITMLALGAGAKRSMEETLSSLGTNVLMVRAPRRSGAVSMGAQGATRFNFADLAAIQKIEGVEDAVPYVSGRAQVVFQNKNWNTSVIGTTADYTTVKDNFPQMGRFFTKAEENSRAKVAIIGQTVSNELFGDENPVGMDLRINRINFNVIGVMPKKGAMGWQNLDDQILVPIKTAMYRLMGKDYIDYFEVKVDNAENMQYVSDEIVNELMRLHRLSEADRQSIDVINMAEIQAAASALIATLSYLLGAVAAVSLLVGGIGIMNIMLVIVMERTHEIGLQKALGAQKSDIMIQFLVESVIICLLGGIIGIAFGGLISWAMSSLAQWNIFISAESIALAFGFSVIVGVVFGMWPAWRAAKLLPIEALRYE